jgi:hypothetical protein
MKQFKILPLVVYLLLTSCGSPKTDQSLSGGQNNSSVPTTTQKVKVDIFNDIEKTRNLLSQNGIGELRSWRSDGMGGFMSITDYYQFGSGNATGMQNNLAYYLESENEDYIKTVKLVLNLNNKGERKQALSKFKQAVQMTFQNLALKIPKGLSEAVENGKLYQADSDMFTTNLKLDQGNVDIWKLIIETK